MNEPDVPVADVNATESALEGTIENDPSSVSATSLINTCEEMLVSQAETSCHRTVFWFLLSKQENSLWGVADRESCRILLSEKFYKLPLKLDLKPTGSKLVLAGNANSPELFG